MARTKSVLNSSNYLPRGRGYKWDAEINQAKEHMQYTKNVIEHEFM